MATDYNEINEVIKELIDGDEGTTIDNFSGVSLKKFAEHQDVFWDGLTKFLQNENEQGRLQHYGIRDLDFLSDGSPAASVQSVAEFINNNADLVDTFLDSLFVLNPENRQTHWNESFNQLIQLYYDCINGTQPIGSTEFTIGDILNANAGNSFNNGEWVVPWKNIDLDNYSEVRKNDKIVRVLNNREHLQFTHLFNKYLRLLMPEYEREVEAEDLNRNFWVIGQVLVAILAYLFNPDNPIRRLMDEMLDEIAQLWENMLYLWTAFALLSQYTVYMDIQPIVIPLNVEALKPYLKYDGFYKNSVILPTTYEDYMVHLEACWNNLKYLKNIYNKSTLFIIPVIRNGSYQSNYHNGEYFPGMIIYNRRYRGGLVNITDNNVSTIENVETEEVEFIPFIIGSIQTPHPLYTQINDAGFTISNATYSTYTLTGVCDKTPIYYFTDNYQENTNDVADGNYIAAIRTVFKNFSTNGAADFFNGNKVENMSIDFVCEDAVKKLIVSTGGELMRGTFILTNANNNPCLICSPTKTDIANSITERKQKAVKGWYRGEMASWYHINETNFNVRVELTWEDIPAGYWEGKTTRIVLSGKDDLGFKVEHKYSVSFTQPQSDEIQTEVVPVLAYGPTGRLANYTAEIEGFANSGWVVSGGEEIINFDSLSKTFRYIIKCVESVSYIYNGNEILYYTGTSPTPGEIPTQYQGTQLTTLSPSVFNGNDKIKEIIIPDGITTIY